MGDGVRLRQQRTTKPVDDSLLNIPLSISEKKNTQPIGIFHLLFVLIIFLLLSIIVIFLEKKLPEPKLLDNEVPGKFVAERARNYIVNLTSIGPRVSGSYDNEVLAVNYLKNVISDIIKGANENHKIKTNFTGRYSGAYVINSFMNVYRNVPNVIVKIGPRVPSQNSLLINCHFDSVIGSPGASDDGAGCAVMLEILRVIAHSPIYLKHNIIFLFNGAEEYMLLASHGFITQHPWAKEVKAFINIEACGAGGREILFQAGPENPWMIEVYSKVVPHPFASSSAQEIFESGIVPSDTDFRIFRDYGKVSGMDFAWSSNGYVYHTKFDTVDQIPLGSLQRTGDNMLALSQAIATSPYLGNPLFQNNDGGLVFFDFLGIYVISWSQNIAIFVNLISIFLGVCSIVLNIRIAQNEIRVLIYLKQIVFCILIILSSWLISIITVTSIALILTKLGNVMSWYAKPVWLFFLYVCPTIAVSMHWFIFFGNHQRKTINSAWILYHIYSDAYIIMWMFLLSSCIVMKIKSGFIPLHWVIFPAVGNVIRHFFFNKCKDWKWLCYQVGTLSLPYVQSFYLAIGALYLFIPIMGRFGASTNSELIMANTLSILFCLLLSFIMPIVLLMKNSGKVISGIIGLFFLSAGILFLTPLGFPYSGDIKSPAPQRFMILHTQRHYYDVNNSLQYSGSGFLILDSDMNSPHSVKDFVPEIGAAISTTEDCNKYLFCGLPFPSSSIASSSWIPGPSPMIEIPTKLDVISKNSWGNSVSFAFNVTGPNHMRIIFSPYEGIELAYYSMINQPCRVPLWKNRKVCFIRYTCAFDCIPYNFSIKLIVPKNHKGPVLTIALVGHFMHGKDQQSEQFKKFLDQFPSWAVTTAWTASYTSLEL